MSAFDTANNVFIVIGVVGVLAGLFKYVFDSQKNAFASDINSPLSDENVMSYFVSKRPEWWAYLWYAKTKPQQVPTVEDIIRLGDDLLFTSSIFQHLKPPTTMDQPCWIPIYSSVLEEIASKALLPQGFNPSFVHDPTLGDFLEKAKSHPKDPIQSQGHTLFEKRELVRLVPFFDGYHSRYASEINPGEGDSRDNTSYTERTSRLWLSSGKPCIKISREELLGLAILLGMSLKWSGDGKTAVKGEGAFPVSLFATINQADMYWHAHLMHTECRPRHSPSRGSGYAPLFAKYMACGLLPFARNTEGNAFQWIESIDLNQDEVLDSLREGGNIIDSRRPHFSKQIEVLRALPKSDFTRAWVFDGSELRNKAYPPVTIGPQNIGGLVKERLGPHGREMGNWWTAVSWIAFGGLVPQTTQKLKHAVLFTISGLSELPDDSDGDSQHSGVRCVEELERFINNAHKQAQTLEVFGKYVAGRGDDDDDAIAFATECCDTRDSAAQFGRYTTLLERLAALCSGPTENIVDEIRGVVSRILRDSYGTAVGSFAWESAGKGDIPDATDQKLGRILRRIRAQFNTMANPSIHTKDCAKVAVCIIAAWAANVQVMRLEPDIKPGNANIEDVFLEDLPSVFALG